MERCQLNDIYRKLDEKAREISQLLYNSTFGYYNGHYYRNKSGDYEIDYFPIPVITIKDTCDIEINFDQISVTTKLTRDGALSYEFEKVKVYRFEAYGVKEYLNDFYIAGNTIDTMIEKIRESQEENIFFSFYFPYEVASNSICEFVKFIKTEGFFY